MKAGRLTPLTSRLRTHDPLNDRKDALALPLRLAALAQWDDRPVLVLRHAPFGRGSEMTAKVLY